MVGIISLSIFIIGVAIGAGKLGNLSAYLRYAVCGILMLASGSGTFYIFFNRKTFRIDISGIGKIRLVEYNGDSAISPLRVWPDKGGSMGELKLRSDSTIWPYLLLLRLEAADQRIMNLPILRDSTDAENFRALAVACRWIAAQNNRDDGKIA